MQVGAALLVGPLAAACCTRVSAQQADVDQLRVLVPLYARPGGECARFGCPPSLLCRDDGTSYVHKSQSQKIDHGLSTTGCLD